MSPFLFDMSHIILERTHLKLLLSGKTLKKQKQIIAVR